MIDIQEKMDGSNKHIISNKAFFALFASTITPAVICAIYFQIILFNTNDVTKTFPLSVTIGGIALTVALIHAFLFGLPLLFLGLRLNLIRWWSTFLGGFIIGSIPCATIIISTSGSTLLNQLPSFIKSTLALGLFGASAGVTFWLLWKHWVHKKQ